MTIDNPTFRKKSEVYGKAYEIYIKQGVIAYLVEQNFISKDDARLAEWKSTRVETIFKAVYYGLNITDPFEKEITKHQLNHLAVCSILSGYTLTREYIKQIYPSIGKNRTSTLKLKAIWCPLTLPNDSSSYSEIVAKDRIPLIKEFNIAPDKQAKLFAKGRMGKADFILYLEDTKKKIEHLLVHEYSYEMPPKSPNFTEQSSHLNEFIRHRRLIEGRGVFANVNAEVEGETFEYLYEPKRDVIVETLLPKYLSTKIYYALIESQTSEHAARMSAMENATSNCGEMVRYLTLVYNKRRQESITNEMMDIVGGAEALRGT